MDASENAISQLRSFQPLASSLQRLFLADNRINSLGALQSFIQLRALDLSHNRIEAIHSGIGSNFIHPILANPCVG